MNLYDIMNKVRADNESAINNKCLYGVLISSREINGVVAYDYAQLLQILKTHYPSKIVDLIMSKDWEIGRIYRSPSDSNEFYCFNMVYIRYGREDEGGVE